MPTLFKPSPRKPLGRARSSASRPVSGRAAATLSVSMRTAIGWRGRVYVSQVDDDVWIGGDTVTGVTGIVHK